MVQATEPHETPRQRFRPDVWVPHDQAEARVRADAQGNQACVCTWHGHS